MLEFIKKILGLNKSTQNSITVPVSENKVYQQHDIIAYDGMGNQGRFPVEKNNNKRKK